MNKIQTTMALSLLSFNELGCFINLFHIGNKIEAIIQSVKLIFILHYVQGHMHCNIKRLNVVM